MGEDCGFGLGFVEFELYGNIKLRVRFMGLEFRFGDINFYIFYIELKLWVRV